MTYIWPYYAFKRKIIAKRSEKLNQPMPISCIHINEMHLIDLNVHNIYFIFLFIETIMIGQKYDLCVICEILKDKFIRIFILTNSCVWLHLSKTLHGTKIFQVRASRNWLIRFWAKSQQRITNNTKFELIPKWILYKKLKYFNWWITNLGTCETRNFVKL